MRHLRLSSICCLLILLFPVPSAPADDPQQPDFQKHILPLLGRMGCSGRACHGSFQGRGGLRLSLFGYDFQSDHAALTATSNKGPRVNPKSPDASLIIQKPTLAIAHEGGRRFEAHSTQADILRRWIAAGAPGTDHPAVLRELLVEPPQLIFSETQPTPSLRVTAVWEDGLPEDVTAFSRFRSNDDSIAEVTEDGQVTFIGRGETHVVVFYDNLVTAVPVLRPFQDHVVRSDPVSSPLDQMINERLQLLHLPHADLCSDSEFLRRASLDATGTLPSPDEVRTFLADSRPDKRERKIDELLSRPAYAAFWANRMCDWTGCNPAQQAELGQETSVQWAEWIRRRLDHNEPWDQLVRGIVLARSRDEGQTWPEYAEEVSAYFLEGGLDRFADRATMPHYWTRRSMQKPDDAAQAFAQNFLGIRLQCAQCHKHPFAP